MPSIELLIAFFTATAVFAYMPGPSTLYAAARTIAGGKRAGWLAAIGIHVGGYVHVFAAAFGLAVIFKATPILYLGLKFVGAAYLIWLGVTMMRTKYSYTDAAGQQPTKTTTRVFWDSATVEILNPKTALFYLAFLPQFTDPVAGSPIWMQLLVLGAVVNILFSSADVLCVMMAARIQELMKGSSTANLWAHRIGGTVLIGLGIRLAVSQK